jgi:hypothetical protein
MGLVQILGSLFLRGNIWSISGVSGLGQIGRRVVALVHTGPDLCLHGSPLFRVNRRGFLKLGMV